MPSTENGPDKGPEEIQATIKRYLLEQFLPGEEPEALTADVELMTTGILDSIAVMQLVSFMEEEFEISFEAHELSVDHMNTLETITKLVASKR